MERWLRIFIWVSLFTLQTSCFKEDEPVPPYVSPPGVTTNVAEIGPYYDKQLFYDLQTDSFIKVVHRESWDLAFQCLEGEFQVFLNSSKLMRVANTLSTNFYQNYNTTGLNWKYDNSGGWLDSTAFGDWGTINGSNYISFNHTYIVDRGLSATTGNNLGYKKVQLLGFQNGQYTVRFANLDGSSEQILSFTKSTLHNFIYISFDQGIVNIEPPKQTWDLLFTQYTTLVTQQSTGIVENYSVNGVLLNPYNVVAAREFNKPFDEIIYTDLANYNFTSQRDIIGYDWKEYNFSLSAYIIYPNKNYIIRDVEGNYYKLRFTSFTNAEGIRGYPTFEVARF
ncbi:MAG: hypothetical protein N2167_11635 [Flavobacteriales bacterium]|nr:hypothetical protein [Flavobacteriales bacterium]